MSRVLNKIRELEKLAEADALGDPSAHRELRKGIYDLQLTMETPRETISRLNFQVRVYTPYLSSTMKPSSLMR